jgi:signal transduction histidine kinase/ligand-binding sensor domain-containing protein
MQFAGKSRRIHRACWGIAVALFCLTVLPGVSSGLDARRSLTQAFQRIWQLQQGLPRASIFAIRQTHDGYLWLATQEGLVRFDGVQFDPAPNRDGISFSDLWVTDLAEDDQQNLWIATIGQGLIRLNQDGARRYTTSDGLPSDDVHSLAHTKSGLWAATNNGVVRVTDTVVAYGTEAGLSTSDVWAVCEAPDGKIYFGGEGNQLSVWDGAAFSTISLSSIRDRSEVRTLLVTPDGCIWVGSTNGLVKLEQGRERLFTKGDGLADDSIFTLTKGSEGCLWIGTKEGFSRYVAGKFESFRSEEGLSQSTALSLLEDREGSLWVGTKHGLNQFIDRRAVIFTMREGLPSNDIGPVMQDAQGKLWVGTLGAGLATYDGERFVTIATTSDGLPSDRIYALAEGADGDLWVGTDLGLARLRNGRVEATFRRNDGLPSDAILCVLFDREFGLWVGTTQGAASLKDGRFEQPKGDSDAQSIPIHSLVTQGESLLMAGGDGRLFRYANGELRAFPFEGEQPYGITALHVNAQGTLWIGTTDDGLFLYKGEKTRHFTSKDGLYDDEIFAIVQDDQDRLWMSCSRGVFYISRAELLAYEPGKSPPLTSSPFTPVDSSRTIECRGGVRPAMWTMNDGGIWCSTIRGLIYIDPKKINRILPPSPVLVEEVVVNGRTYAPDRLVDLPAGNANLEFRCAALSYIAPTRTTFRFKLEGFDEDWIKAGGRREAFYTNLPPGTYQFRVMARKFPTGEYEESAPMPSFTIMPQFYQRIWFFPLCAVLVALAAWGAYRLRVRRIKDQMRAVVSERSRIARELHDTLIQGFSGVTMQMQALSTRLPLTEERENLQEIIHDAGICLRDARRSVAGLRHEPEGQSSLATAITHAAKQLTETHDVRLKLQVQRDLPALPLDVEYNLLRIAQEAIANAVKHSDAESIDVSLERAADDILLTIQDDGNGFMESSGSGAPLGHYGLVGMRERSTQIGADFSLESEPGRGTRICVIMPILRSEQIAR